MGIKKVYIPKYFFWIKIYNFCKFKFKDKYNLKVHFIIRKRFV